MTKTQYGLSITDSVFITTNEGATWTNITDNLPSDVLGGDLTEFGGHIFIAYGSANQGIYRRTTSTGISQNNTSNRMSIYPNPFNDRIVLSNLSNERIKHISIFDIHGKLVLSENGEMDRMNTSDIIDGQYIIEIVFTNNSTLRRKLIKAQTIRYN